MSKSRYFSSQHIQEKDRIPPIFFDSQALQKYSRYNIFTLVHLIFAKVSYASFGKFLLYAISLFKVIFDGSLALKILYLQAGYTSYLTFYAMLSL